MAADGLAAAFGGSHDPTGAGRRAAMARWSGPDRADDGAMCTGAPGPHYAGHVRHRSRERLALAEAGDHQEALDLGEVKRRTDESGLGQRVRIGLDRLNLADEQTLRVGAAHLGAK